MLKKPPRRDDSEHFSTQMAEKIFETPLHADVHVCDVWEGESSVKEQSASSQLLRYDALGC